MALETIEKVHVSTSPHIRAGGTTQRIMLDVCIALIPACAAGIFAYGFRALLVLVLSVASSVLTEYLFEKISRKPLTVQDCSAVVTGLILGCNLPSTVPFWIPILGGVFAILVVKMLYGGLGQNFMNPALAARCFLLISFAKIMTTFPDTVRTLFQGGTVVSSATPLAAVAAGTDINWFNMIFDMHTGCIGEASSICILLGFVYLLCRRVVTPRIPLVYIGSTIVFIVILQLITGNAQILTFNYIVAQICGGGLLIGACFMANDYVTSPVTRTGDLIYALLLGLLTSLFRVLGSSTEGVSYAIIIGNCIVPLIDRITIPKPFGREKTPKKEGTKA